MAKIDINYAWNFLYEEAIKIEAEMTSLDVKLKELGRKDRKLHKLLQKMPATTDSGCIDDKTIKQIIDLVGTEAIKEID